MTQDTKRNIGFEFTLELDIRGLSRLVENLKAHNVYRVPLAINKNKKKMVSIAKFGKTRIIWK